MNGDGYVNGHIKNGSVVRPSVFVPMCGDSINVGHINILEAAAKRGSVHVLLMTDDAMKTYKRVPRMLYEQRERIMRALHQVSEVIACEGPDKYAEMTTKYRPQFFCHGDDWKTGPQANARAQVISALSQYGGELLEMTYTKGVSSKKFANMYHSTPQESRHIGVLIRTCLNDLKRIPDVVEKETGLSSSVIDNMILGQDTDFENIDSVTRTLHQTYPATMKHLVVDRDDSADGVWYMAAAASEKSGRTMDRVNGHGEKVQYYNYMDTATSALSPFKPELIEELVHVTDTNPYNPLVVLNKGHLLSQLTFFIGPVNFYCTVRGETHFKAMNTGDSCLITPYVPHSFSSRDPSQFAAIVAVTFSGYVRDVLSDLVHHDIQKLMSHAGDRRDDCSVFNRKLERYSELRGMSVSDIKKALTQKMGHTEEAVEGTISRKNIDSSVLQSLSDLLDVPRSEFEIERLERDQEVTYSPPPPEEWAKESSKHALASCKHHPEAGGYVWHLKGEETLTSQFFNYLYNYGEVDMKLTWNGRTQTVAHGDSVVIKPFISVTFAADGAKVVVCKVPGCVNSGVMHECSLFANEGLQRMNHDTTKWW
jgi:methylphosphonate synthase